jgi:dihydrofolate reductase
MNLIVNVDKNWAIGNNGELLVTLKGDMQYFKQMTTGKVIVLGKETLKTFPSGKPLKNRTNIVMTTDRTLSIENAIIANSIEALLEELKKYNPEDVFVVGGESVYKQLLPYVDKAYITKCATENPADKFLPNLDLLPEWKLAETSEVHEENDVTYSFNLYVKTIPL